MLTQFEISLRQVVAHLTTQIPSPKLTVGTWKWGRNPKRKQSSSNQPFSGAMLVSWKTEKLPGKLPWWEQFRAPARAKSLLPFPAALEIATRASKKNTEWCSGLFLKVWSQGCLGASSKIRLQLNLIGPSCIWISLLWSMSRTTLFPRTVLVPSVIKPTLHSMQQFPIATTKHSRFQQLLTNHTRALRYSFTALPKNPGILIFPKKKTPKSSKNQVRKRFMTQLDQPKLLGGRSPTVTLQQPFLPKGHLNSPSPKGHKNKRRSERSPTAARSPFSRSKRAFQNRKAVRTAVGIFPPNAWDFRLEIRNGLFVEADGIFSAFPSFLRLIPHR